MGLVHGSQRRPESADVPQCPRPRVHRGCSDRQIDRDSDAYSPTARFVATTAKCTETGHTVWRLSVPDLVVMPKLGVSQHYLGPLGPTYPDQDDTSVRLVIAVRR